MEDVKIKNEKQDNKQEDEARYQETQNEALVKIETNSTAEDLDRLHAITYKDWKIKNEDLDIKDLNESNVSISTDCVCQDTEVKCERCAPERSNQPDDELLLKSNLYQNLSKTDTIVEKTSLKRPHLQHKYLEESKTSLPSQKKVNMFKCNKCDFQTKHKISLNAHLLRHNSPEEVQKFKCDQCCYKTIFKRDFNAHLLRHKNPEEVEMLKCNKCNFQTKNKYSLKTHLLRHNPEQVQKFKCEQCSYETIFKRDFNTHRLRHGNS